LLIEREKEREREDIVLKDTIYYLLPKTSKDNLLGEGFSAPFLLFNIIPMTEKACSR
jgi:hypothetical protein